MHRIVVSANPNRLHALWRNFLWDAPRGYEYVFEHSDIQVKSSLFVVKRAIPLVDLTYKQISEYRLTSRLRRLDATMMYMINGQLARGTNLPWIVDFENPYAFCNFQQQSLWWYRGIVESRLNSDSCRAILAYSEVGARGFLEVFPNVEPSKVHVIPNCVPIPDVQTTERSGRTILFTGSTNIDDNFELRGGPIAVEVFSALRTQFPDLQMIIRSRLPERFEYVRTLPGVTVIEERLSQEEFHDLFRFSDIYLFPAFIGYALSCLEAMSWGLPVVTTDVLENGEYVLDGITGYTVENEKISYHSSSIPEYLHVGYKKYAFSWSKEFVEALASRVSMLLQDSHLRMSMGSRAREHVRDNYSLDRKNSLLKKLYDQTINDPKL